MAAGVPARLTAAEGRKFGLTVGSAFLVLGTVAMWRGKRRTAIVLQSLGGVLILAGIFIPTMLGPVERAWMGLAHLISKVTTPIFMSIVYFVVITPIGYLRRLSTGGMGAPKTPTASNWKAHTPAVAVRESMERQF
ncbi:MAG: SxtJ family membrane protein [bacterium]